MTMPPLNICNSQEEALQSLAIGWQGYQYSFLIKEDKHDLWHIKPRENIQFHQLNHNVTREITRDMEQV